MIEEFYWINTFNMVEFDGPFSSAEDAKAAAVKAMTAAQGMALSITIVKSVENGSISTTSMWVAR